MNTDIGAIVRALQNAEHPLLIIKEVIPEEYAIFVALVSFLQVDAGKNITILSRGPLQGWFKQFSAHYGIEVDQGTEPLKHIIEIPVADGSVASTSYDVSDGKFYLYIIPGVAKFDFSKVSFRTTGARHDVMVTIGFSSSEDIYNLLGDAKSSILSADHVVMGTTNVSKIEENGIQTTHHVDTSLVTLAKVVLALTKGKLSDQSKELAATLLLKVNPAEVKDRVFLAEVYRVLSELFKNGADVESITKVSFDKRPEYAALYKKIAEKTKINVQKKSASAYITRSDVEQSGLVTSDLLISFAELVKSLQVNNAVLSIENTSDSTIVYASGTSDELIDLASKLDLTVVDSIAAGIAGRDIVRKVLQDKGLLQEVAPTPAPKREEPRQPQPPQQRQQQPPRRDQRQAPAPTQMRENTRPQQQVPQPKPQVAPVQPKPQTQPQPDQQQVQQTVEQPQNQYPQNEAESSEPRIQHIVSRPKDEQTASTVPAMLPERPEIPEVKQDDEDIDVRPMQVSNAPQTMPPVQVNQTPQPQQMQQQDPQNRMTPSFQPSANNSIGRTLNFGDIAKKMRSNQ